MSVGREKAIEKLALSKAWAIQGLMDTIAEARQAVPVLDAKGKPIGEIRQNLSAAVRAYELFGKELGMFVDRKEIRTSRIDSMTREELEARRDELLAKMGSPSSSIDATVDGLEGRNSSTLTPA